ncbi:MAG: amidohydrolase family protein [Chloroflexota bacterium]
MPVQTVLGPIAAAELGVTACHEHVLWNLPDHLAGEDTDLGLDSIPAAVAELRYFKSAGGNSLVEMTTPEIGRSPQELKQVSLATGIHIITITGHHKEKFSAAALTGQSVEQIASRMVTEICEGIEGSPIKAGAIKVATSLNHASESEQRVIQAAALAHAETGAPVTTHTEAGTFAIQQADMLLAAGIAPDKILIGHVDRNQPHEMYFELAARGVFLGFDQIGKEKYWPDSQRALLIRALIDAGHERQILLSSDLARKSSWKVHNPQTLGLGHVLLVFIPLLMEHGLSNEQIHALLVDNPARFLDFGS